MNFFCNAVMPAMLNQHQGFYLCSCFSVIDTVLTINVSTPEAKYIERWPSTTSAWAGSRGFDILEKRYSGVPSLLLSTSCTLASPTFQ